MSAEAREAVDRLSFRVDQLEAQKDGAYKERDMLVALISKVFPSWLERHPESDKDWDDDWRWIVFVELPTGQASWHIHDSELEWFNHCVRCRPELTSHGKPSWDGHTTEEKYKRVMEVKVEVGSK